MNNFPYFYFIAISLVTMITTCIDKSAAKRDKWRVPEKTLFILALLGGSAAEYFTMITIRHKTKHKRFMIGLPALMVIQLAAIISILIFL